ncbi:MAG: T9SS type A sorting domain-containing protein [Bacteroidota bacterium]|nr:T9SS type A sorting domain-containing protein [Bacteroidota bacterium]
MKRKIQLCLLSSLLSLFSYSQDIQWAQSEPFRSVVTWSNKTTHDKFGNSFISSQHDDGVLVVKYDATGNKLWEKNYYGYGDVKSLCTDTSGNLYAGIMIAGLTIDGIQYLTHTGGGGYLFLKLNNVSGSTVWVKQMDISIFLSEKTDSQDQIVCSGNYQGVTHLDNGITLTSPGGASFYMAKFNLNGECIWALQEDGSRFSPLRISNDCLYASSWFNTDSITLGKGTKKITLYLSNGMGYKAKYDANGELVWVKQTNGSLLAPDPFGNSYNYGSGKINKYDPAGNLLWSRTSIFISDWYTGEMKCNNKGDLFLCGGFKNTLKINDSIIYGGANYRTFIMKIDSAGQLKWVRTSTGSGGSGAKDISLSDNDEIYITGDMWGSNTFGSSAVTQTQGVFAVKLMDLDIATPVHTLTVLISSELSIYPNPTNNVLNVFYENKSEAGQLTILITNAQGKNIFKESISDFNGSLNKQINLNGYAKGTYFVEVVSSKKRDVTKVVVQ